MQLMDNRPPYVRFEQRAVEDRAKSDETGLTQYKDVVFALITSAGSKDVHEERAESWLKKQEQYAKIDRIPFEHYTYFQARYDSYLKGLEMPENGIPIKMWPSISPAQQQQVLQANIRTVEDLANASEEALERIGMGGRALKQKAESYLMSGDQGKSAAELNNMKVALEDANRRNERLESQINEMADRLAELEKPKKRGRPKSVAADDSTKSG